LHTLQGGARDRETQSWVKAEVAATGVRLQSAEDFGTFSSTLLSRLSEAIPLLYAAFYLADDADRKSTRLNSSHVEISYAVFCLKKKSDARFRPGDRGLSKFAGYQLEIREFLRAHGQDFRRLASSREGPYRRHSAARRRICFGGNGNAGRKRNSERGGPARSPHPV